MKQLLQCTRLTVPMLEQMAALSTDCVANDQRPTTSDCLSAVGQSLAQLLKRPEITIERLLPVLRELAPEFFDEEEIRANPRESVAAVSSSLRNELKSVETEIKYEGYLLQQQRAIERLKKAEQRAIPHGSTMVRSAASPARCRKN